MASQSLISFNAALKRFGRVTVPEVCVKAQRKLANDALRKLVLRTPVKTGRARGGWQTEIAAKEQVVTALQGIAQRHAKTDKSGAATIAEGAAVIATSPPFCIVCIQNNVEYILELEKGHSQKQAPHGMLALTFAELRAAFA